MYRNLGEVGSVFSAIKKTKFFICLTKTSAPQTFSCSHH